MTEVYNADGTLASTLENVTVVDNVGIQPAFGGVNIYGTDMELISQLKHASQRLDLLEGGYLRFYGEGEYMVLDLMGQPVSQERYQQILCVADGCIIARKETGWGMTALTGEEVLPYVYSRIQDYGADRLMLEDAEGTQLLYNRNDASVIDATGLKGKGLYIYQETDAGREYLLQYGGETKLFSGEIDELDHGLILTDEGLFELYTGKQILKGYDYDRYAYCDGYVYARMYGIWTVFQVKVAS